MTLPRRILPGTTYLLTRRCAQRTFRFVPRQATTQIFGYCLAVVALRHRIELHAYVCCSNHYHAVLTDSHGNICDFIRDLHSLVARAVNAHQGCWENLWASDKTSLVELDGPQDAMRKLTYVLTNVVKAGLVDTGTKWPGLRSTASDVLLRGGREFERPKRFFRGHDKSPLPKAARIVVTVPPQLRGDDPREFVARLQRAVRSEEERLRGQAKAEGRTFLGTRRVRAQRHTSRPKTRAPRRGRNPTIAACDKHRRIGRLAELSKFRHAYQNARQAWLAETPGPPFPRGTLLLAGYPGVRIEASPGTPHPPPA